MSLDLEPCAEGERWNPCGGRREVFAFEGMTLASCELCGTVTDVTGEDVGWDDDIFAAAPTKLPPGPIPREPRGNYYCDDGSDLSPYTRTARF